MNQLYFGDNLAWLRKTREFPDAIVDFVYYDPPFNSNVDFVEAVVVGKTVHPTFDDGLQSQRVLEAVTVSTRAKRWAPL